MIKDFSPNKGIVFLYKKVGTGVRIRNSEKMGNKYHLYQTKVKFYIYSVKSKVDDAIIQ